MKVSVAASLPTKFGSFSIQVVEERPGKEHVLLWKGDVADREGVPVRIHSECLTGEVFHSLRCDCEEQLKAAQRYIEHAGFGVLVYLRQEGRGIGLFNKIQAYALQDKGLDTVEANEQLGLPVDSRTYHFAAAILKMLRIRSIRLLTNNPVKIESLEREGISILECVPLRISPNPHNSTYLRTKRKKLNHTV